MIAKRAQSAITTTNQTVLFHLLSSIILPGHAPAALTLRRSDLAQRNASIEHVATLPVPFSPALPWLLLPGQQFDWALMPIEADPLYQDKRGFPMPGVLIKKLRRLSRSGVDFDAIWIAHEVEAGRLWSGKRLAVEDLMPPVPPKRRPAWHGIAAAIAGALGLAALRGAFGAGQALGTMQAMPAWTPPETPQRMPAVRQAHRPALVAPAVQPEPARKAAERTETPTQAITALQPVERPCALPVQRSEPVAVVVAPVIESKPVELTPARALQSRSVVLADGSRYITHDVTKTPRIDQHGREVYPDQHGFFYPEWFNADGSIRKSCVVDPILFGVNVEQGIADLFYLGSWGYGSQ